MEVSRQAILKSKKIALEKREFYALFKRTKKFKLEFKKFLKAGSSSANVGKRFKRLAM